MATPFPFGSGNTLLASQLNAITTLPINDQTASYVAVVGDVGKRIVMNVATANTVTINNSVFGVGDEIFIACKGAGSTTVTAGAGVTINTASSLVLAQHGGGTLVALSASVFAFFSQQSASYGTATGGTSSSITVSSVNYTLLAFTTDATLTVSKAGLFDVMLVGGGGGGGSWSSTANEGGGGAGGITVATIYLAATTYPVDVGAGGAVSIRGFDSTLGSVTVGSTVAPVAVGGGGGGRTSGVKSGGSSGSGGNNDGTVYSSVIGQGFANGTGVSLGDNFGAGGGGGAGAVGGNGTVVVGGAGGAGISIASFIQTATTVAGGGGGNRYSGSSGAGGAGGGGAAGGTAAGTAGTANTGGGGGAGNGGAAGGSGVVYVRFKV